MTENAPTEVPEQEAGTDSEYMTRESAPKDDPAARELEWPETAVNPIKVRWRYALGIPGVHLLACLAFLPWFFSWTGVVLSILGLYVFGTLGVNLCYHRLLTHQGFTTPKWLEHFFAILGVCTMQDTPACWIAMHRIHHKHSDEQPDPHSPLVNFLWGHCGWLMFHNRDFLNVNCYQRFTRDILRDPFYLKLERNENWLLIYLASMVVFFLGGFGVDLAMGGSMPEAAQFGSSSACLGRVGADGADLAYHLERELVHPRLGLPQLRDRRQQP